MKFKELAKKNKEDLDKIMVDSKLELLKQNAQVAAGTVAQNPGQIKQLKKTIAKVKQLQNT